MTSDNIMALVGYRLDQADESFRAAAMLLQGGLIRPAVNRAYYAMFYAVLALLASQKRETSKHSGAISLFDREYVKTGIFPKELSRWLHDAFNLSQRCDYAVKCMPSGEEAEEILANAVSFVEKVKQNMGRGAG